MRDSLRGNLRLDLRGTRLDESKQKTMNEATSRQAYSAVPKRVWYKVLGWVEANLEAKMAYGHPTSRLGVPVLV